MTTLSSPPYNGTEVDGPQTGVGPVQVIAVHDHLVRVVLVRIAQWRNKNAAPFARQGANVDRAVTDGEVNVVALQPQAPLPAPPSPRLADAARFLPTAANVAETRPTARGANRTVTVHDLRGPRLAPVQVVRRDRECRRAKHRDAQGARGPSAAVHQGERPLRPAPRSTPGLTHTATVRRPAPPAQPRRTPRRPAPQPVPSTPPPPPRPARPKPPRTATPPTRASPKYPPRHATPITKPGPDFRHRQRCSQPETATSMKAPAPPDTQPNDVNSLPVTGGKPLTHTAARRRTE